MKRILLGLLLVTPLAAMEEGPRHFTNIQRREITNKLLNAEVANKSIISIIEKLLGQEELSKEEIIQKLLNSAVADESKLSTVKKLLDLNERLSEEDIKLLEGYNVSPKQENIDYSNNNNEE